MSVRDWRDFEELSLEELKAENEQLKEKLSIMGEKYKEKVGELLRLRSLTEDLVDALEGYCPHVTPPEVKAYRSDFPREEK